MFGVDDFRSLNKAAVNAIARTQNDKEVQSVYRENMIELESMWGGSPARGLGVTGRCNLNSLEGESSRSR